MQAVINDVAPLLLTTTTANMPKASSNYPSERIEICECCNKPLSGRQRREHAKLARELTFQQIGEQPSDDEGSESAQDSSADSHQVNNFKDINYTTNLYHDSVNFGAWNSDCSCSR